MMKMLDRFKGRTATFVDENGLSAGAFISAATQDIYFSPTAVVGSAAPVQGGGEEIATSMRQKIMSFLRARVRAIASGEEHRYRAEVVTAMMDASFVLRVEGEILKDKDALLALNADEAARMFGNPPQALFSSGTAENMEDLLNKKYGEGNWERRDFEMTWSVDLARFLTSSTITSLLLGVGLLCLYLEFKTPGFGAFGITGGLLLAVVFFGHHVAGLSGHEAAIIFAFGLALIIVEIFVFPGTLIAGITGAILVLGSLVWGMADVWPQSDGSGFVIDPGAFTRPLANLGVGLGLSLVGLILVWRFLPRTPLYSQLILGSANTSSSPGVLASKSARPSFGALGLAVTDLHPTGQVEIDGQRYEATSVLGDIRAGDRVRVVGSGAFELRVEAFGR
jgi:membrane-bound serine protease (ClpP class)